MRCFMFYQSIWLPLVLIHFGIHCFGNVGKFTLATWTSISTLIKRILDGDDINWRQVFYWQAFGKRWSGTYLYIAASMIIILVNEYPQPYMQEVFVHFTHTTVLFWYVIMHNVMNCYISPHGYHQIVPTGRWSCGLELMVVVYVLI